MEVCDIRKKILKVCLLWEKIGALGLEPGLDVKEGFWTADQSDAVYEVEKPFKILKAGKASNLDWAAREHVCSTSGVNYNRSLVDEKNVCYWVSKIAKCQFKFCFKLVIL